MTELTLPVRPSGVFSAAPNATSWDNGCQKRPLLTPFLTPVAPRRARDRVPSILALGLFLPVSDFAQPENGLPTPPPPPPPPSLYHPSGSAMPFTQEPGPSKQPWPPP